MVRYCGGISSKAYTMAVHECSGSISLESFKPMQISNTAPLNVKLRCAAWYQVLLFKITVSHAPNFSVTWNVFPSLLKARFESGKFHLNDEVLKLKCSQTSAWKFSIPVYVNIQGFLFSTFKWEMGQRIQVSKHRCLQHFRCLFFSRTAAVFHSPRT